jgi:hypothetical protein
MAGSRHAQNAPGKVIEVCFVKLEMLLTFFHLQNTHLYEHTLNGWFTLARYLRQFCIRSAGLVMKKKLKNVLA